MRQRPLKPMKIVFRPQTENLRTPLALAFRKIPGLRAKWAEDDTVYATGRGKVKGQDHLYPHSPTRMGVYIERPTVGTFNTRIKRLQKELDGVQDIEYNCGDQDGTVTFPWAAVVRLRDFFKKARKNNAIH